MYLPHWDLQRPCHFAICAIVIINTNLKNFEKAKAHIYNCITSYKDYSIQNQVMSVLYMEHYTNFHILNIITLQNMQ